MDCTNDVKIKKVNQTYEKLNLKSIETEKKIETHFQNISECLQRRKEKLLNEVKTIYEKKCEMLNEQLEYFQSLPLTATNNIDISTNESIDFHITDIDSIKHHFIQEKENYLTKLVDNYGEVLTTNVNSKQCTASGNGLVKCFMDKETTFTLTCRDTNSNMAKISLNFISISIENSSDNTHCPVATRTCRVEPISEGLFVVRYAISKIGTYYMNILVNNEPIKNSPFKLYCVEYRSPESSSCLSREAKPIIINKSKTFHRLTALVKDQDTDISLSLHSTSITPTLKKLPSQSLKRDDLCFSIGSKGRLHARFLNPQSVYIHENENQIYVTDSTNKRVDVFSLSTDNNFEFKYSFNGNSVLKRPVGIAVFNTDRLLVTDYDLKCVHVFGLNGKYFEKFGYNKLMGPKGICITQLNEIIVSDCKSNSICVFNSSFRFLKRFGVLGNKNENFAGPHHVDVLSNGNLVITDFYNHCIKVFDMNGQFQFCFGMNGTLNGGEFNGPTGCTVDKYDNILIADWGNCRIHVFDKHGKFIKFVNNSVNGIYGPQGICVSNKFNVIACADSGNHCVKFYNYL